MIEKDIIAILSATRRKHMEAVIVELQKMGYFEIPASIRYQNIFEGGLAKLAISTYECALEIREDLIVSTPEYEDELPLDSIAIVSLLCNVYKCELYRKNSHGKYYEDISRFPCGRGEQSVILLLRLGLELTDDEILAIRWHLMEGNEVNELSQDQEYIRMAQRNCALLRIINQADARATRKALNSAKGITCSYWDADRWVIEFSNATLRKDNERHHSLRRKVYETTLKAVMDGFYFISEDQVVTLPLNPNIASETVFCEKEIRPKEPSHKFVTRVEVVGMDCLDLAKDLTTKLGSEHVALLNMASWRNPGGGAVRGTGAQEEYLFRCTDYFRSLYQYVDYSEQYHVSRNPRFSYPLNENFGVIFTPGVTVFRGNEASGYPFLDQPWKINFIAVAAHSKPETIVIDGQTRLVRSEEAFMKGKIRSILRIALRNDQTILILGPLGCGVRRNPPRHVAEIFRTVLLEHEFDGVFQEVYFAIVDDSHSNSNLSIFQEVFG